MGCNHAPLASSAADTPKAVVSLPVAFISPGEFEIDSGSITGWSAKTWLRVSLLLASLATGNFEVAEANGEPCSGSAKT